jgi:outer membrane protein OmpA-like peptidoglycan-associated protein
MTEALSTDLPSAELQPLNGVELHRVAGEDTPPWIAGGLAALGVVLALVAGTQAFAPGGAHRARAAMRAAEFDAPSLAEIAFARRRLQEELLAAEAPSDKVAAPQSAEQPCLPIVAAAFAHDSARPELAGLDQAVAPLLDRLAEHAESALLIEGHTDPTGAERHNVLLSYQRAQAVGVWLQSRGVATARMTIRAAGPALPTAPAPVVADNRQALIMIEGAPRCSSGAQNDR